MTFAFPMLASCLLTGSAFIVLLALVLQSRNVLVLD